MPDVTENYGMGEKTTSKAIKWIICISPALLKYFLAKNILSSDILENRKIISSSHISDLIFLKYVNMANFGTQIYSKRKPKDEIGQRYLKSSLSELIDKAISSDKPYLKHPRSQIKLVMEKLFQLKN